MSLFREKESRNTDLICRRELKLKVNETVCHLRKQVVRSLPSVFLDSVERGFPMKDCISEVHEKVRFRKQIKVASITVCSVKGPAECADGAKGSTFREVPLFHQVVG